MNLLNHKYEDCKNMLNKFNGKKIPLRVYSNNISTHDTSTPKMFRVESLDASFVWEGLACCPFCARYKALFDYAIKK